MVKVLFKYRDDYSHGEWRTQQCTVSDIQKAKEIYGLGVDCDYKIISVEELD